MNNDFKIKIVMIFVICIIFIGAENIYAQIDLTNKQIILEDKTLIKSGHNQFISDIVVINNGKNIATTSMDNTIKIWDIENKDITATLHTKGFGITDLCPTSTENIIATAGKENISIWDVSLRKVVRDWTAHSDWISSVFMTNGDEYIISAGRDSYVKVWNFENGTMLSEIKTDKPVNHAVSDAENTSIYIASDSDFITINDFNDGTEIGKLEGHTQYVNRLLPDYENNILYSAGGDGKVIKWDLETNTNIGEVSFGSIVKTIQKDNQTGNIIIGTMEGVYLYNDALDTELGKDLTEYMYITEFDDATNTIFSAGNQNFIKIYNNNLEEQSTLQKPLSPPLNAVSITAEADKLITSGKGMGIYVWSIENASYLTEVKKSEEGTNDILLIDKYNKLITAGIDGTVRLYSILEYGASTIKEFKYEEEVLQFDYSTNTETVLYSSDTDIYKLKVSVGDNADDFQDEKIISADNTIVRAVFSPDDAYIYSVNWLGVVEKWDPSSGELLDAYDFYEAITDIVISKDGNIIFAGTESGYIITLDILNDTRSEINFFKAIGNINTLYYIDEKDILMVGGERNEIVAYSVSEGKVLYTLTGHSSEITDITGRTGSNQIAVASSDGRISLWNYEDIGLSGFFHHFDNDEWAIYTNDGYHTKSDNASELISFYNDKGEVVDDLELANNKEILTKRLEGEVSANTLESDIRDIAELIKKADEQITAGEYDSAEISLKEAEAMLEPKHEYIMPYYNQVYGNLMLAKEKYNEAEKAYKNALKIAWGQSGLEELSGNVNISLGKVYTALEKYEEAYAVFKDALEYEYYFDDNKTADVLISIGFTLEKLKKYDDAVAYYNKALEYELSNEYRKRILLGLARLSEELGNYKESAEYYISVIQYVEVDEEKAEYYTKAGDNYYKLGSQSEALKYYEKSLSFIPENNTEELYTAYKKLSELAEKLGNNEKAYEYLNTATNYLDKSNNSEVIEVYKKLTELSKLLKDYQTAIRNLEYLRQYLSPDNTTELLENYMEVAGLYMELGKTADAIKNYEEAIKLLDKSDFDNYYNIYRNIGLLYEDISDNEGALKTYTNLKNNIPETDYPRLFENYMDIARVSLKNKDDENAVNYFEKAKALLDKTDEVDYADFYETLGGIYEVLRKYTDAVDNYEKAYDEVEPDDNERKVRILVKISALYSLLGEYDKAKDAVEEAISISDKADAMTMWQLYNQVGFLYERQGEYDKARDAYMKSMEASSKTTDLYKYAYSLNKIGKIYEHEENHTLALDYYNKAKDTIEKVEINDIDEQELYGDILHNLSNTLRKEKQFDDALTYGLESLTQLESINSYNMSKCLLNLGNIYLETGNFEDADSYYYKALNDAVSKNNREYQAKILNNRAVLRVEEGLFDEAIEDYNKSIKLKRLEGDFSGAVKTYRNLALLYERMSELRKALEVLEKAIDLIKLYDLPDSEDITDYISEIEYMIENLNRIYNEDYE